MLFNLVLVIKEKVGVTIELVNLGGGFGIPYRPEEKVIDVQAGILLGWCLKSGRTSSMFGMPRVKAMEHSCIIIDHSYLGHLTAHGFPPGRRLWDSQDLSGDD